MKKFSKVILLFLLTAITINNNANANMLNKFKKGFYFEKYKTAEEAKSALLELHPIGSDVDALVKTLEGAGSFIKKYKTYYKEVIYFYEYEDNRIMWLNPLKWSGGIRYKNSKIINYEVNKYYTGL